MIKGFIFDLDGVITDTANLHFKAWKNKVAELGIDYSVEENEKLRGLPRRATLEAILAMKAPDLHLTDEQINKLCTEKNDAYIKLLQEEINEGSLLPGIKRLLMEAKDEGIKLAIASSSYNAPMILEKLGIRELFDYIVYPGDIQKGKPAPDIFLKAAEGLGLPVDECVAFEDAIAGVLGIKSANMRAVAITNGSKEDYSDADLIYHSTEDLDLMEIMKYWA
ncbi:beta-phosphoglucomutase [Mycoplasma hafezii]|uniref:beta-phosphoglucomutase n=1 Tax=Mycoplasma hafezii TaxID=525886 RepID=UPI003CEF134C